MPRVGLEPTIAALERAATVIVINNMWQAVKMKKLQSMKETKKHRPLGEPMFSEIHILKALQEKYSFT
jgi:hypothetical protein